MRTPECEKLAAVSGRSQEIGQFLQWLGEKGIHLAVAHEHEDGCRGSHGFLSCGYTAKGLEWYHLNIEKLLADYFEIDLEKIEKERRAILAQLRRKDARRIVKEEFKRKSLVGK